jgi:3-dehydroquinate dehydratase-1
MNTFTLGPITLDRPRVVGTVLASDFFARISAEITEKCDIVEARLDGFDLTEPAPVLEAIRRVTGLGIPVIATVRLPEDGGHWKGSDTDRREILEASLRVASTIDIELNSPLCADLCTLATELNKPIIVSHHDFKETPASAELIRLMEKMLVWPNALPKLALKADTPEDICNLMRLAADYAPMRPVCIMGMGDAATATRTALPALGTRFTYGYLDRPSAPGQKSSGEILALLHQLGARSRTIKT